VRAPGQRRGPGGPGEDAPAREGRSGRGAPSAGGGAWEARGDLPGEFRKGSVCKGTVAAGACGAGACSVALGLRLAAGGHVALGVGKARFQEGRGRLDGLCRLRGVAAARQLSRERTVNVGRIP